MATIKVDVTDVEAGGGGEQPQPGLYNGKLVSVTHRDKKSNGDPTSDLEVIVDVGQEYSRLWSYINLESPAARWKLREFLDAVGLPAKVELTPQKLKALQGKLVLAKVVADTDLDGEYRGKVKNLFMPGTKEATAGSSNGDGEAAGDSDYGEWSDDDLKAELATREIKLSGRFSSDKAIAALEEDDGSAAGPVDDPEPDAAEGPAGELDPALVQDLSTDPEFYEGWPDDDIKSFVDDLGIKGNISGRYSRQKGIDAVVSLAESVLGGGDDPDAPAEDDYDEWTDDDLQAEIDARIEQGAEIRVTGRKTTDKLIAALRADDAGADPF